MPLSGAGVGDIGEVDLSVSFEGVSAVLKFQSGGVSVQ